MSVQYRINAINKKEKEANTESFDLEKPINRKSRTIYVQSKQLTNKIIQNVFLIYIGNKFKDLPEKEKSNFIKEEMNKIKEAPKEIVYIEQTEKIRNKVQIFENSVKKNVLLKEEEEQRQRLYEQNRANMRERMRRLKEFIREKKELSKTDEEFFEQYKKYFAQYDVKSYLELQKLINNYDEMEREEKYKKNLGIIKNGDFSILPEIKRFDNLNIENNSEKNNIYFKQYKNYFKKLQKCNDIINYNIIPDIKEYLYNKISKYEIKRIDNEEIKRNKKYKYNNESELIESSNINDFKLEKIPNNIICSGENYTENGIPIEELRNKKIKKIIQDFSEEDKNNYEKVEKIMNNIKTKYDSDLNSNNIFCLNCNECFSTNKKDEHSEHLTLEIDDNNNDLDIDLNELDYNASLNKLYNNLKKDQNKILKYGNDKLIIYYGQLLFDLYGLIINNNSIEELNKSIIDINDNYKEEIESNNLNQFFKDYFLFNVKKIEKYSYLKKIKIEKILADLDEDNNFGKNIIYQINENNSNSEKIYQKKKNSDINLDSVYADENSENLKLKKNILDKNKEDDKKKLFLKIGLGLKYKFGKKESITELYSKAKEDEINPLKYEDFIIKELHIPKIN